MSNNALLLFFGVFCFCWGGIEFLVGKAYVRTGWTWEFGKITKEERPYRYWSSVGLKMGGGFIMLVALICRQLMGITS